ncbi:hypothetical protein JD969_06355 [Planctomycetota bacterium]|nr:hypothetical protein JD969_06355 [Planctomycetota bacterium]
MKRRKWFTEIISATTYPRMRDYKFSFPEFDKHLTDTDTHDNEEKKNEELNIRPQMLHTPHKYIQEMQERRINSHRTFKQHRRPH